MSGRLWTDDFKLEEGAILVKKTGHRIVPDLALAHSIFTWFCFYFFVQNWRTWRLLTGHKRPTMAFYPDKPRPWYFIWSVMHVSGARLVDDISTADIVMQFDDSTETANDVPAVKPGAHVLNFGCTDISKSRVSAAFEKASGESLAVNPTTFAGRMVEKSELNAAHDGRILEGPLDAPVEGKTYQRLIDNEIPGGLVEDLRCCLVGGSPVIVFRKRRPLERRFLNENVQVLLDEPRNCYSQEEIKMIERFAAEIGLDWGGVDVLRDRASGKIFIVDANKTDMGPPVALKLGAKLCATRRMARAFAEKFASKKR
ncbi:hypothetical protein HPO_02792 [Hyphomonas polymorpha PS728]|uniref:ATP-grasp domain-containing protein n=1 Tax=Hyphomonas polymorpha PS728 TaxID=1280954 RepID=A0A062VPU0_9PROT|nr:hypothetical protein [Hyphomonas polymorpha]KDA00306.1 hypothetical protein HPO_02792 [Hyphomonas polymorpha PS728]